ncbi:MAG: aspartate aminotransferase family protein [Phocaeicola sp.]
MKLYDVYPLFDIEIASGKGCKVWDEKGTEYLDLYGGHAVISIGHAHPHYVERISEQVAKLGFYSNSVKNPLQEELAVELGKQSGYEDYQLFLINSGAEANENALKLASFHNGRTRVISFNKAFHGRTSLAVEATANPAIIAPINANGHVTFLPLNDIDAVKEEIEKGDVCAVIIEGILGVGGIQIPTNEFLQQLSALCTATNTALILDEIQSGYGRSGKFFAHQYAGIRPDMITVAKGIANGFPMGGLLIAPKFKPVYGQLGTTFGGNHLACAGALAVLEVMKAENLIENAAKVGTYLIDELKKFSQIKDVRGEGLMIGLEFEEPIKEIRRKLLFEQKIFTGVTGTHVIRLLPPLCLTMEQADYFLAKLKKVL